MPGQGSRNDAPQDDAGQESEQPVHPSDEPAPRRARSVGISLAWVGAAAVFLYLVIRIPYAVYYDSLGTTPEEVGLGYPGLLVQSATLAALIAGLATGILIFVLAFPKLLRRSRRGRRPVRTVRDWLVSLFPDWLRWLFPVLVFAFWSLYLTLPLILVARHEVDRVRGCQAAEKWPGFALVGHPVQLLDARTLAPQFPDRKLMFLGGDATRYVLFDCRNGGTVRVPASGVAVVDEPLPG